MAARTKTARKTSRKGSTSSSKAPRRRSLLWRFRRGFFLVALLLVASVAGAGFVLAQVELPPEDPLLQSTFVCAADVTQGCNADNAIAKLAGEVDRVSVPLDEIPKTFIDAVLAAEDRQFFSHNGIDPVGIGRALYRDLRNEGVRQGGSTITQQYVKNAYLTSERTFTRKLKEAVLAIKLERELSKEQILQRYLNTVYFGRGAYGAEAAARAYFGKSIRSVELSEAAYLAGLIRSPESADVTRSLDTATFRRDSVLRGMVDYGVITSDEADAAVAIPLDSLVRERTVREGLGNVVGAEYGTEHYVEYVRRRLYDKYGAEVVNGGGLRVYTALDLDRQRAAYESVWSVLDEPDDPNAALVSIDDLGRVVAMVGGKDFDESQVNYALGRAAGGSGRQPGSSFKPIVLATALEQGLSPRSQFLNENEHIFPKANAGDDWKVSNYDDGKEDVIDLVEATRISSNTVYAKLMLEVGPANVAHLARELGVTADLPVVNSLALGGGDVSVIDMASAYSTFARRGQSIEPIIITKVEQVVDGEVKVLEQASTKADQAMSVENADAVNWILRQVVLNGTGASANPGVPAAGKTGTTQDYRDAWFVGYTPELTTAVWMGYDPTVDDPNTPEDEGGEPRFMTDVHGRRVTGGSFPAQIWKAYMQRALDGVDSGSFVAPKPFTGEVLGADLTTTTTTLPFCDADDESETTEPCRTTTTTTEATTTSSSTSTTKPPSSTTSSTITPSSSSTTAPPSSSSTTKPPSSTTSSTVPDIGD